MDQKLEQLKEILRDLKSVAIAFSGGCDSTFLAAIAGEVLGRDKVLLVTATSSTYTESEFNDSKTFARMLNLNQEIIVSEELEVKGFSENTVERCYYCKKALFTKITALAAQRGFNAVLDGSNMDDLSDFRPGRRAVKEFKVKSPLCEVQLSKDEIRSASRIMNLPSGTKPAMACLASRFPYGENITGEKLQRVGRAEEMIRKLGFKQFRVRSHDNMARVEVESSQMNKAWEVKEELNSICKSAGFKYVAIDLQGYRCGAMNESLSEAASIDFS